MSQTIVETALVPLEMKQRALVVPSDAASMVVTDQPTYQAAIDAIRGWKALAEEFDVKLNPNIKRWHDGHKEAIKEKADFQSPILQAIAIVTGKAQQFIAHQRKIQDDLLRAAQIEERLREEEARLQAAVHTEAQGASLEEVEAVLEMPLPLPRPARTVPSFQPVSGTATPRRWRGQCDDVYKLCRAIADRQPGASPSLLVGWSQIPGTSSYTSPALNQLATALKEAFVLPGCRAIPVDGLSVRR